MYVEVVASQNSVIFWDTLLNPSPINAKLTSLFYIHASKSLVYFYISLSANFHRYHSNNSYGAKTVITRSAITPPKVNRFGW